jgi:hypothetical protein
VRQAGSGRQAAHSLSELFNSIYHHHLPLFILVPRAITTIETIAENCEQISIPYDSFHFSRSPPPSAAAAAALNFFIIIDVLNFFPLFSLFYSFLSASAAAPLTKLFLSLACTFFLSLFSSLLCRVTIQTEVESNFSAVIGNFLLLSLLAHEAFGASF